MLWHFGGILINLVVGFWILLSALLQSKKPRRERPVIPVPQYLICLWQRMMNDCPTKDHKKDPQEKHPPPDVSLTGQREKDKIPTRKVNAEKQYRERWPDRLMATMSVLLVVVTGLYTECARQQTQLSRKALVTTKDALAENTRQFSATLQEMKEQTVAAQAASAAAEKAAVAAGRSAESAGKQVVAMREQTTAAIEAMRLDQRAWLGYRSYVVQAREGPNSPWDNREPKAGEQVRGRFYIQNVGKTPAYSLRVMNVKPVIIPNGGDAPNEPEEWLIGPRAAVVFPNEKGLNQNTLPMVMSDQQFLAYSNAAVEIFFWAKLSYCDVAKRRQWVQIGVAHDSRSGGFSVRSSSISPDPGKADHPDCQN